MENHLRDTNKPERNKDGQDFKTRITNPRKQ